MTEHDFLGEHYDHTAKTRCLTKKTEAKGSYVCQLLQRKDTFTTKQLRAIYGLLIYAAGTLQMTMAKYHWALRFLSHVAGTEEDTNHTVPAAVLIELVDWSRTAATNSPVPVWTPTMEPDFTIYTDASAYGYGAISISKGGNVLQLAKQWTAEDKEAWNVTSSVTAEPLAIQRAVAALVPNTAKKVVIYTDHLPFVYAHERTVGKAYMYSRTIQFMSAYKTEFEVRFVEGVQNPADVLSRARKFTPLCQPRLLNVTSIGDAAFREREEERGPG